MGTRTRLHSIRQQRGIAAAELAKLAGVARQTIYAIEAGDYVPNTAVALQMAQSSRNTRPKQKPSPITAIHGTKG